MKIKLSLSNDGIDKQFVSERDCGSYVLRSEIWTLKQDPSCPTDIVAAYTKDGQYIGDTKTAKYIVDKMGILPEISDPEHTVCSIGWCEKEGKWAGWSHRALALFGLGDKVFEEDFGDDNTPFIAHGKKTIKNMDDARLAAQRFARSVSSYQAVSSAKIPLQYVSHSEFMDALSKTGHAWFDDMEKVKQDAYLKAHPDSKIAGIVGDAVDNVAATPKAAAVKAVTTAKDIAREQREFFHGKDDEAGSKPRRTMGKFLKDKLHGVVKAMKHEVREFKYAGEALADVFHGKQIDKHQKAAIKTVLIHSLLVIGPIAVTGGLSAGLTHVLPHIAGGFLEHSLVMSAGKAAIFASEQPTTDELMKRLVDKFADYVADADISKDEWNAAFDAAKQKL